MATSLLSACGITDEIKFMFIKENSDIDGSFLISALIGQRIKQVNSSVILICTHQTLKYYNLSAMKLGYNLSSAVTKNNVKVIEPMNEIFTNKLNDFSLQDLNNNLKEHLESQLNENKTQITIILDNLMFFHNTTSDLPLIEFAHNLFQLSEKHENISIVLKMNLSNLYETIANNIEDMADLCLNLEPLESGNFRDVDGKIVVKKIDSQNKENESTVLYKINDRNIKIFAPGEFGLQI